MCGAVCQVLGVMSDVRCWRRIRCKRVCDVWGGIPDIGRYIRCKVVGQCCHQRKQSRQIMDTDDGLATDAAVHNPD